MGDRRIRQKLERGIILHIVVLDNAAMTVRCVLAQTHVRNQEQIANIFSNCAERLLNDAVVVVCVGTGIVFLWR